MQQLPNTVIPESKNELKPEPVEEAMNEVNEDPWLNTARLSLTKAIKGYAMYPAIKNITRASKRKLTAVSFLLKLFFYNSDIFLQKLKFYIVPCLENLVLIS